MSEEETKQPVPAPEEKEEEAPEEKEEEGIDIPELAIGLVIGLEKNGNFYLRQLSQPLALPILDAVAVKGMLEVGVRFLDQMLSDNTRIGTEYRTHHLLKVSEALTKGVATIAGDLAAYRQLIANSQQTNAELLRFVRGVDTPAETPAETEEKTEAETEKETE